MTGYLTLNGNRAWHDVRGDGEPLVLLHGGFSDSRDFDDNLARLADQFTVHRFDRRAHGRTPDVPGPVTLDQLADDAAAFLENVVGGPAAVAGSSSGGVVALATALRRPDLVSRLILINTGASPDGWLVHPDPEGEFPAEVVDAYAEVSPDGRDHFPEMVRKFAGMEQGPALDPAGVDCPTLVLGADDDIVSLAHTVEVYQAIRDAQLAILPGTSHLMLWERPDEAVALVREFLTRAPNRMMPIRFSVPVA